MMKIFGPCDNRSRRASMELSINAIVILVLAMAILGLGLGIVKGVKSKSNEFLDVDVDLSVTADATNTIANMKQEVSATLNKPTKSVISFYSKTSCDSAKTAIVCTSGTDDAGNVEAEMTQPGAKLSPGEASSLLFNFVPSADGGFEGGVDYFCNLIVYCSDNSGTYSDNELDRYSFRMDI